MVSSRKSRFKKPKKQFVLTADWDEKVDGPWDPSKEVSEKVFGVLQKGVWVLQGKKGHFEFEEEDELAVESVNREEHGDDEIVAAAIDTKLNVLHADMAALSKDRDAVTVEAPMRSAADVFSLAGLAPPGTAGTDADDDCGTVVYSYGNDGPEPECDYESEDDEEGGADAVECGATRGWIFPAGEARRRPGDGGGEGEGKGGREGRGLWPGEGWREGGGLWPGEGWREAGEVSRGEAQQLRPASIARACDGRRFGCCSLFWRCRRFVFGRAHCQDAEVGGRVVYPHEGAYETI